MADSGNWEDTGCFCCSAKTCLIAWSTLSAAVAVINLIVGFTDGSANLDDGNTIVNLIACLIDIGVNLFVLLAALSESRKALRVGFWFVIINIVTTLIMMILGILFLSDALGSAQYDNEGGAIIFVVVFYFVVMAVQGLLAWTINKTINEINISKVNPNITATPASDRSGFHFP